MCEYLRPFPYDGVWENISYDNITSIIEFFFVSIHVPKTTGTCIPRSCDWTLL